MCALKKRLTITTTPRQTCDSSKTNRTHRVMRSDNSITFGALIMTGGREWRGAIISQPLLFLSIVHCAPRSSVLCVNSSNRPKERERERNIESIPLDTKSKLEKPTKQPCCCRFWSISAIQRNSIHIQGLECQRYTSIYVRNSYGTQTV